MNENLKHISTTALLNEILDRHDLRLRGFGCFYHFLQCLTANWSCKCSSGEPTTDPNTVITTNFKFDDGSTLSASEKRSDIVKWCDFEHNHHCTEVVIQNMREYGLKGV